MIGDDDAGRHDDDDDPRDNDRDEDAREQAFAAGGWGWTLSPRQIVDLWSCGGHRTRRLVDNYLASQRDQETAALQEWLWPRPSDLPGYDDRAIFPNDPGWRLFD